MTGAGECAAALNLKEESSFTQVTPGGSKTPYSECETLRSGPLGKTNLLLPQVYNTSFHGNRERTSNSSHAVLNE